MMPHNTFLFFTGSISLAADEIVFRWPLNMSIVLWPMQRTGVS